MEGSKLSNDKFNNVLKQLEENVPNVPKGIKMTKLKVMDFAIQYISHLKQLEAVLKKTSKKNHGEFSPLHNNKPKLPKKTPTKRPRKQNLANCHVFYKLGENCCSTGALKQTKSSTRSQAPKQGIKHVYKLISQQKPVAYRLAEPSTEEDSEKNVDKKVQRNQTEPINYSVKSKDDSENQQESAVQQSQESLENKEDNQETKQKSDENLTLNHPSGQKRHAEDKNEEDCKEVKIEGEEQIANCKKAKVETSSGDRSGVINLCVSEDECQVLTEGSDETLFSAAYRKEVDELINASDENYLDNEDSPKDWSEFEKYCQNLVGIDLRTEENKKRSYQETKAEETMQQDEPKEENYNEQEYIAVNNEAWSEHGTSNNLEEEASYDQQNGPSTSCQQESQPAVYNHVAEQYCSIRSYQYEPSTGLKTAEMPCYYTAYYHKQFPYNNALEYTYMQQYEK